VEQGPRAAGEHAGAGPACVGLPGGAAPGRPFRDPVAQEQGLPLWYTPIAQLQIIYKLQCLAKLRCRCTAQFIPTVSVGLVHVRCLCDALQQAGGMASWVTRSRAMGTSICVAATKTVKILSRVAFSRLDIVVWTG